MQDPPATWETWVHFQGWEDPLEEGIATHSSILAWKIPMDRGAWHTPVHGVTKSRTQRSSTVQHGIIWNHVCEIFLKLQSIIEFEESDIQEKS